MKISVQTRNGKNLGAFTLEDGASLASLQKVFHEAHSTYYPHRQRFYINQDPSTGKKPTALSAQDVLTDQTTLIFKDLGPQIPWKTVFLIEYLGPLLIYPIFYTQPTWIYGTYLSEASNWAKEAQLSALIAWTIHYAKRELETLFVHRFSHATMPFRNIFKNSGYYWGFAAFVAYFVNHPLYTPPSQEMAVAGMCLFYFMEVGNFTTHLTLRALRPAGSTQRKIPRGGLFRFVSCPNYTYEICAWLGFNLMTRTVAGILFMCAGALQMIIWAQGKHRRYRKEFDGKDGKPLYPPNRKSIVPFIF